MSSWNRPIPQKRQLPKPIPPPPAVMTPSGLDTLKDKFIIPCNHTRSNITNIYIKYTDNTNESYITSYHAIHAALDVTITYLSEYKFLLNIVVREKGSDYDGRITIYLHHATQKGIFTAIPLTGVYDTYQKEHTSSFSLKKDEENGYVHRIPKIIHQSYKQGLRYNNYKATSSWKDMNPDFEYRYWTDNDIEMFLKAKFDESVWEAYDKLYAGAYKSDLFRLCILYEYGGIWIDISAVCETPLRQLIEEKDNLIVPIDTPSERLFFIYQAFIISPAKSDIIKFILDYTVDRVLQYEVYDDIYKKELGGYNVHNDPLAVTGPGTFGMALNIWSQKNLDTKFVMGVQKIRDQYIKFCNNTGIHVVYHGVTLLCLKYPNFNNDRYNQHYSTLYHNGLCIKTHFVDTCPKTESPYNTSIFHIHLPSCYVLKNVNNTLTSWSQHHPTFQNILITECRFLEDLSQDQTAEMSGLLSIYETISSPILKREIIKLYYLYTYGGFYTDNNIRCLMNCAHLLKNYSLVLCRDPTTNVIYPVFIGATQKHPILLEILHRIIDTYTAIDDAVLLKHVATLWRDSIGDKIDTSIYRMDYTKKVPYFWNPLHAPKGSSQQNVMMIGYDSKSQECYIYQEDLLYYNN